MPPRDRQFNLVVGFRGHGKSTFVANQVLASKDKNALIYIEEEDIDADAWAAFPLVDFYKYKGGKCKVSSANIDYESFLRAVIKYFRNGIVVVDEGRQHEEYKLTKPMLRLVSQCRKFGVDIYILYHSMRGLPIEQFDNVNNVVLFHTTSNFTSKGNSIPEVAALQVMQTRIRNEVFKGNKYYAEVLKLVP